MDTGTTRLHRLIVHRVGNRSRDEGTSLSARSADISGAVADTLIGRYLWGAQALGTHYRFHHESDLALNEIRTFANQIFADEGCFEEASRAIAKHLYSRSTHTSIPEGDLFVVLFAIESESAAHAKVLGLFKAEIKDRFLIVDHRAETLSLEERTGIDPRNLQKAALIFQDDERVIAIERGNQNTRYWIDDFLRLKPVADARAAASVVSSIVKRALVEMDGPSIVAAFKADVYECVSSDNDLKVSDVLALTSQYIGEDRAMDVMAGIENELGCKVSSEASPERKHLNRALGSTLRSTRVAHGIDLNFSKGVRPLSVEVISSDDGCTFDVSINVKAPK